MVNTCLYNTFFSKTSQKLGGALKKKTTQDLSALFNSKKNLLVPTFANLIIQLAITYYVMEKYNIDDKKKGSANLQIFLYFLIQLLIIVVLTIFSLPSIIKFILFTIFSYTFGVQLAYIRYFTSGEVIRFALLGTISIFAVMFAIGTFMILSGINLGYKYGLLLFYVLLGLIIMRLVTMFTNTMSIFYQILSVISILLFSVYIIYDTNVILQRDYYGDFITASLDYYLDILNIFINFLSFNNN
jgi:FtsH-binding integral membrane protein